MVARKREGDEPRAVALPAGERCFIESQFPVSKMSKESYAERTAKQSQTLTGLGKWWGRKPLVLCRAAILGVLLPATSDPAKDREVFLRLMTMDDEGMIRRKLTPIPAKLLYRCLPPVDRARYFAAGSSEEKARIKPGLGKTEKEQLQRRVFLGLSYDERLAYCERPEQIDGPSVESWGVINAHLGTQATSLPELVRELGERRFGRVPRVGDSFCGGGSIPFEAARLGCDAYGSDLNPIAALLTWASLNIVGGGKKVAAEVQAAQRAVFDAVDRQLSAWGIEHRAPDPKSHRRWRADAYLYCVEATCPECNWRIPLAPSWVIGKGTMTIARLVADPGRQAFDFEIERGASERAVRDAAASGTARNSELHCPNPACGKRTPIKAIRGDGRGSYGENRSLLRPWQNTDLVPREDDIFGERLYCVRWVDSWRGQDGKERSERSYRAPTPEDAARETRVLELLEERFEEWQAKGFIPSLPIEPGAKTNEPIRTRGWTHWHHLFAPRQLLVNGLLKAASSDANASPVAQAGLLLASHRCADWNSRLSRWNPGVANEKCEQTFSNQALNSLANFGTRPLLALDTTWFARITESSLKGISRIMVCDARKISDFSDIWITDPPYADAVCYEELTEFFLSWAWAAIPNLFPDWYVDSRRALAVKGSDDGFRRAMADCYRTLAHNMPDNGLQVVMFTHQDAAVWSDLALILWSAGLRVTAAWCIATETDSALKEGNYVQGTVLLVLRKQGKLGVAFLDEVYQEVEVEVRAQLDSMLALDDARDPSFADADYQLAAYAAALRVLTSKQIEEIDISHELTRARVAGEPSKVEELIRDAVRIACDHLVPRGLEPHLWKTLSATERLYFKGLEVESHGERRAGVYQELARGFGVGDYTILLASKQANQTRLRTATEFGRRELASEGFGRTALRHALFGIFKTAETERPREALTWLATELPDYASARPRLLEILEIIARLRQNRSMTHWHKDADAAAVLAGALRNRQDNV